MVGLSEKIEDGVICCICGNKVEDNGDGVGYKRPCKKVGCVEARKRMMEIEKRRVKEINN